MLINLAAKEKRAKYVSVVFLILVTFLWPAKWKSCASSAQARADMQKPVGLCFVHQGSTFWHVVQNRARHDNSKVQRFDSNGSYEFSNALSSYPGCSKIKIYFLLFPHEGCANPQTWYNPLLDCLVTPNHQPLSIPSPAMAHTMAASQAVRAISKLKNPKSETVHLS